MRLIFLIIALVIIKSSNGQSFSYQIDQKEFKVALPEKDVTINAEYRINWIQIGVSFPSKEKAGRFNSIGLVIYGKAIGTYQVGCCDKNNYNEPFENNITANWFDRFGQQQNKSADQGEIEHNKGVITLTKIEGNSISGNFNCIISGTQLKGSFENIKVKNWPQ